MPFPDRKGVVCVTEQSIAEGKHCGPPWASSQENHAERRKIWVGDNSALGHFSWKMQGCLDMTGLEGTALRHRKPGLTCFLPLPETDTLIACQWAVRQRAALDQHWNGCVLSAASAVLLLCKEHSSLGTDQTKCLWGVCLGFEFLNSCLNSVVFRVPVSPDATILFSPTYLHSKRPKSPYISQNYISIINFRSAS